MALLPILLSIAHKRLRKREKKRVEAANLLASKKVAWTKFAIG